jgi:glycosyltransferase involved in cell wall biosynthesis
MVCWPEGAVAIGGLLSVNVVFVIPAYNEAESLPELARQIESAMTPTGRSWKVIVVDDGSNDETPKVLDELSVKYSWCGFVSFQRNYGKSAALELGFAEAEGEHIVTMDADLQDDPAGVPMLLNKLDEGFDLVSGWKRVRHDPLSKRAPSKLFNRVTSWVSGVRLHDFNCGLKAYKAYVAKGLPVYGEMHRFLPAIAHWQGYNVTELPVNHRARQFGESKFGASRFVNGFLDLITVTFVHSGKRSPLHVFGRIGLALGLVGSVILIWFGITWVSGGAVRMRPIFFIGLILAILAFQFISLGLLGELVIKGQQRPEYRVRSRETK